MSGFGELRREFFRLETALVWTEILDAVIPEAEPSREVYALAIGAMEFLCSPRHPAGVLAWSDLRLMGLSGIAPDFGSAARAESALVSPAAGGVVSAGELEDGDRSFRVSGRAMAALRQLPTLAEPPNNLLPAAEVSRVLLEFWVEFVGRDLPARRRLVADASKWKPG
jgi:recombinational DNA repair protein (RecF pathway)